MADFTLSPWQADTLAQAAHQTAAGGLLVPNGVLRQGHRALLAAGLLERNGPRLRITDDGLRALRAFRGAE